MVSVLKTADGATQAEPPHMKASTRSDRLADVHAVPVPAVRRRAVEDVLRGSSLTREHTEPRP